MTRLRAQKPSRKQRGAYAIEFALVFIVFFSLLYGIICYGTLFAFRLGLQNAAEDGARSALQYQVNLDERRKRAQLVAADRSKWMPNSVKPLVSAKVCVVETNNCAPVACGPAWVQRCQIVVTVQSSNMGSLFPPLPFFSMPNQIAGSASMLLDTRSLP